jgi:hypothetical protein
VDKYQKMVEVVQEYPVHAFNMIFEWRPKFRDPMSKMVIGEWLPIYRWPSLTTVQEGWKEWAYGYNGGMPLCDLEARWGTRWRNGTPIGRTNWARRKRMAEMVELVMDVMDCNDVNAIQCIQKFFPPRLFSYRQLYDWTLKPLHSDRSPASSWEAAIRSRMRID